MSHKEWEDTTKNHFVLKAIKLVRKGKRGWVAGKEALLYKLHEPFLICMIVKEAKLLCKHI